MVVMWQKVFQGEKREYSTEILNLYNLMGLWHMTCHVTKWYHTVGWGFDTTHYTANILIYLTNAIHFTLITDLMNMYTSIYCRIIVINSGHIIYWVVSCISWVTVVKLYKSISTLNCSNLESHFVHKLVHIKHCHTHKSELGKIYLQTCKDIKRLKDTKSPQKISKDPKILKAVERH